MEIWPIFDQNHGLTPLKKSQFFDFFNLLFIQSREAFLPFRTTLNIFFQPIYPKLKIWKSYQFQTNTGAKPWTKPIGKIPIFRLFQILVSILYKGVSSLFIIVKHTFLAYFPLNKNLEKLAIFDQNHGLTPLEKPQFFDFFNFLFLQSRKAFLSSRIS